MKPSVLIAIGIVALAGAALLWAGPIEAMNNEGVRRMEAGDYAGAVASLRDAVAQWPGNEQIRRNLGAAYNAWGVELGERKQFDEAIAQLNQALSVSGELPAVRRNLGVVHANYGLALTEQAQYDAAEKQFAKAYQYAASDEVGQVDQNRANNFFRAAQTWRERGRDDYARRFLEKSLEIVPDFLPSIMTLAELTYADGDSATAQALWQRARELDPTMQGLDERIERVGRELATEGGFGQTESAHFIITHGEEVDGQMRRDVLDFLEQAWRDIGAELKYYPARRIAVVLYTREQFDAVTAAPHWSGGLYDGKIRVPLPLDPDRPGALAQVRETLRHEYTHVVVRELAGGKAPAWFNEGLATFFEVEADDRPAREHQELGELAALARQGPLDAVTRLPDAAFSAAERTQAEAAYTLARNLIGWMAGEHHAYKFRPLLESLGKGTPLEQAVREVYGFTPDELELNWKQAIGVY